MIRCEEFCIFSLSIVSELYAVNVVVWDNESGVGVGLFVWVFWLLICFFFFFNFYFVLYF